MSPEKAYVDTQTAQQYECVAVNFDMNPSDGNPFTSIIASVTDADISDTLAEGEGPGACTYEPTSIRGSRLCAT